MLAATELRTDQFISVIAFSCLLLLIGGFQQFSHASKPKAAFSRSQPVYTLPIQPVPILQTNQGSLSAQANPVAGTASGDLTSITASAAAVIDLDSHTLLYQKNSDKRVLPASTTKLMTALVVRDLYQLDTVITINEQQSFQSVDDSSIDFVAGEQLTVESLLQALLVQSSNEAALILANHHPEGRPAFIAAMNQKANQLNLTNSHFTNVTGFDAPNHYTSARDLALLSQSIMADEVIRAMVRQPQTLITDLTGREQHFLYSTNELLYADPTVVGIKTGTTEGAGEVLITQVERDGKRILLVVLGSQDRYLDTRNLINWVFNNHQWRAFDAAN